MAMPVTPDDYRAFVTCYACPNQVEGEFDGQLFYFRARFGEWSLCRVRPGPEASWERIDFDNPVAEGDDESAGYWEPEEFLPFCERLVRQHFSSKAQ